MDNIYSDENVKLTYLTSKEDIISIEIKNSNSPIIVNCPQNILAFQSHENCENKRIDNLDLNIKHLLKALGKRTTIKITELYGPSRAIINSNNHSQIKVFSIDENDNFVFFNYPSLLFYSNGINAKYYLSTQDKMINHLLIQQFDMLHVSLLGKGILGYCGEGEVFEYNIPKDETCFINQMALIGYKCKKGKEIKPLLRTYGNALAGQNMKYHYRIEGPITVILQSQLLSNDLENMTKKNGAIQYFKKIVDSIVPFPIPW